MMKLNDDLNLKTKDNFDERHKSYIQFINEAPSAIAMFDQQMCYLAASEEWRKDYNLIGTSLLGVSHYQVSPYVREDWKIIHQRCLKGEKLSAEEDFYQRSNGENKWIKWNVKPWHTTENDIGGILIHTSDITLAKEKELLLYKYQDLLERSNQTARIGTWEVDLETMDTTWSSVTEQIHEVEEGYIPSVYTGIDFYKEGVSRRTIAHRFEVCQSTGRHFDLELVIVTAKGREKWVRTTGIPVWNNGKIVRVYGTFQDIDEKTRSNEALALQEEQFRQTFEYAANGMAIIGLRGEWLKVNKSLCEILGYSKSEILGQNFNEFTYEEDREKSRELLTQLSLGEIPTYQMEKRYFHKNGSIVWCLVSKSVVNDSLGKPIHFVSQINNITQRKQAEFQLQKSIVKLQGIQDASTQVCILEYDLNGKVIFFNKGAENLLGYSASEVIDKKSASFIHLEIELQQRAIELSNEFGELVSAQQSIFTYPLKGLFETKEWLYVRKDKTTFPILLTITAIKNKDGMVNGYLAIATDISEIKTAENEVNSLLTLTKEQNDRLLNFAHIVSHNLRSHSGNLSMIMELIQMEIPEATQNDFFPLLLQSSDNLKETISHLNEVVAMNNKTGENLESLNLKEYIVKAIANVKGQTLEVGGRFNVKVNENIQVEAIPAYLESVILNLLTNAIKYRSPERDLVISITTEVETAFVSVIFSDNGVGIDLQLNGSKIFGMYKTFHGNEDARGVGLFITKNQIETMGGRIIVESEVDQGTTFKIYLKHD
ncbi:MAG: PAS domain S-box-containing protein [Candidatus Endobugula sp.]|jgi:PAS domain S-box-containing protein